jgi:ATP-binding cassette, subfamily B (MDR/TAP), member 7
MLHKHPSLQWLFEFFNFFNSEVFDHLHALDLKFHLSRKTGSLSAIIDRGKRGTTFILNSLVFNIIPTVIELAIVWGLLHYNFGFDYALTALLTIAIYSAFTISVTSWRTKFRKKMNRVENEASSKVIDSLINYETVKFFGNEKHEANKYQDFLKEYENDSIKVQNSLSFLNFGQQLIFSAALTTIMIMTSSGVISGKFTVGDLVLVNTMLFQLSIPLNFLGTIYREITQAIADMENMFALLNVNSEVKDKPGAKDLVLTNGEITFEDVSFSYDEKNVILKNVSFTIEPGMTIGICGTSGSGKSTLLRLIFRFLNPDSGRILIDGQDISNVTLSSLRSFIGVIPQDTVLFNDSILYNIQYGNLNASEAEVKDVIERSFLKETIERFPDGLKTNVGERGLKLSGGEKQRVAIARTLLKKPRILLCDEATSALDLTTEKNIMDSIYKISKEMTTLMIAHRLSTIQNADLIFVLGESGKILEIGNHFDLLKKNGTYSEMWKKQEFESKD